jgi:hypothetical protein
MKRVDFFISQPTPFDGIFISEAVEPRSLLEGNTFITVVIGEVEEARLR